MLKNQWLQMLGVAGVLLLGGSTACFGLELAITDDTYVQISNSGDPSARSTNFGNSDVLWVNGEEWVDWGASRTLMKFDHTKIPKDTKQIKLKLYLSQLDSRNGYDAKIEVYKITSEWQEQSATWDDQPDFDNGTMYSSIVIPHSASQGWYDLDITTLVKEWQAGTSVNYGLLLYNTPEYSGGGFRIFYSSDSSDTTKRPYLSFDGTPGIQGTAPWGTSHGVVCKNNTRGRSVIIKPTTQPDWDCEKAGLSVKSGDRVTVTITGSKK